MHISRYIFFSLMAIVGICAMYYTYVFFMKWDCYASLQYQITPVEISWKVKKNYRDRFYLCANYFFWKRDVLVDGETEFISSSLRSEYEASKKLEEERKKNWVVWFDRKGNYSSLEKKFPLKEAIYALLLWMIALYFWMLEQYVQYTFGQKNIYKEDVSQ